MKDKKAILEGRISTNFHWTKRINSRRGNGKLLFFFRNLSCVFGRGKET
jgi:hypothetical protein